MKEGFSVVTIEACLLIGDLDTPKYFSHVKWCALYHLFTKVFIND